MQEPQTSSLWLRKSHINPRHSCETKNSTWLKPERKDDAGSKEQTLSVERLAKAKKTALRRGVWYRVLSKIERGVLDLTVRYVDTIRSSKLAKLVTAILEKLTSAMENVLVRLVRTIGAPMARRMSEIAMTWGNFSASAWAEDANFARYLSTSYCAKASMPQC